MARNDFTNPAVLKAEVELRESLISYENESVKYRCLYNEYYILRTSADNGPDIGQSIAEYRESAHAKYIQSKYDTLYESEVKLAKLLNTYNEKLTAYKSLIGF